MAETDGLEAPDWRGSPVARMVMETIDALKEATGGRAPIALTDTQSAFDTATLVLDASEFLASCHEDPPRVDRFMRLINDAVADFSEAQLARVGPALAARPGHIMPSFRGGPGISVSDDNLAVSSPEINRRVSFPANRELAGAFGGVAIHSCGRWDRTMALLDAGSGVFMVDCALARAWDPQPNDPVRVREALAGKDIILKARVGSDLDEAESLLARVADPDGRLVVEFGWQGGAAAAAYGRLRRFMDRLYRR